MNRLLAALLAACLWVAPASAQTFQGQIPADNVVGNFSGAAALLPVFTPVPNCAGGLIYSTTTHLFGCNNSSAVGRTPVADTNYTVLSTDSLIAYTSLTASRSVQLPAASTFVAGRVLTLEDASGSSGLSATLAITPTGADTIDGVNASQSVIGTPFGRVQIISDGVSKWTVAKNALTGDVAAAEYSGRAAVSTIQPGVVTLGKMANLTGLSVIGSAGTSTATPTAITGTTDQIARINTAGTALAFGSINLAGSGAVGASILPLANGGTNAALTASNGGLVFSTGSALSILAGTATAGQIPRSGSNAVGSWSTATYPPTSAAGTVLGSTSANVIAATANPVLGAVGTTGTIGLSGTTSGTATLTPQAAAGAPTLTLPNTSGTLADGASAPLVLSATTGNLTCPTCVTSSGGGAITGTSPVSVSAAGAVSVQGATGQVLTGSGGTGSAFSATPTLGAVGTQGTIALAGTTSGSVTQTTQAAAGTATVTWGSNSGTPVVSAATPLAITPSTGSISITGAAGQVPNGATGAFTATPTLGVAGTTLGTLSLTGNTSGTVLVTPQATAGATTLTLPNTSGTIAASATAPIALSATTGGLSLNANGVTNSFLATMAANTFKANTTAGVAAPADATLGTTLSFSGGGLITNAMTGDVTTSANSFATTISANAVTNAKMATMGANTVKANATGGTATPTDVTPATARSSSLLNIDQITGHGDSIYTILATDRTVATNAAFTASRTWTLPAASAVNPGQQLLVADFQGTVTVTNTLVISRAGADTINGGTTVTINSANGAFLLWSDGTSKWTAQQIGGGSVSGVSSIGGLTGAVSVAAPLVASGSSIALGGRSAQGRLTLTANTPVMSASATAQSTLRYDCYNGQYVPYFNGTVDLLDPITSCEVTDAMVATNTSGGLLANQVFDVWWVHGGANRICVATSAAAGAAGNGWAGDTAGTSTARGTGYSQLDLTTRGYITNKNAITNCWNGATNYGSVAVNQGTYLGTICTDAVGNGQVSFTFGSAAAGGGGARFCVWNAYNRKLIGAAVTDTTAGYAYTLVTIRQADGSTGNQIVVVNGQNEESFSCLYRSRATLAAVVGASAVFGCGLDTTTAFTGGDAFIYNPTAGTMIGANAIASVFNPGTGIHTISGNEKSDGTNAATFNADSLNTLNGQFPM